MLILHAMQHCPSGVFAVTLVTEEERDWRCAILSFLDCTAEMTRSACWGGA
jgi:hypothetical protein